jgi:hypothetical protein
MERRRFTHEFKLEAVRLIKDRGLSYVQAARDLGVQAAWAFPFAGPLWRLMVDAFGPLMALLRGPFFTFNCPSTIRTIWRKTALRQNDANFGIGTLGFAGAIPPELVFFQSGVVSDRRSRQTEVQPVPSFSRQRGRWCRACRRARAATSTGPAILRVSPRPGMLLLRKHPKARPRVEADRFPREPKLS